MAARYKSVPIDFQRGTSMKTRMAAIGLCLFAASNAWALPGPVHQWNFDEASGSVAVDTGSGPAADGAMGPGAIRIPGVVGPGAVRFNAFDLNGYVDMSPDVAAFGTGDFTISFWMQKTPGSRFGELVGNRGSFDSGGTFVDFRGSDSNISLEIMEDGSGRGYIPIGTGVGASDGQWHQVIGVRSGPNAWVYIDGVLRGSGSAADGVTANLTAVFPFSVGVNNVERVHRDLNCGCSFDDVRIYNRAVSQIEIEGPVAALDRLLAMIDSFDLPHGIANALSAKVRAALAYIAVGDVNGAVDVLGAFMNQLRAQSDKHVPAVQAVALSDLASEIIAVLQ